MEKFLKHLKRNCIFAFAGFMAVGLFLIIFPGLVAKLAGYIIGALMVGFGVTRLIGYFDKDEEKKKGVFSLTVGIISSIAGIYIIAKPQVVSNFIVSIFGVIILVSGIVKLGNASKIRRSKMKKWLAAFITGLISAVAGIVFIINPAVSHDIIMRILGGVLIFEGVSDLFTVLSVASEFKDIKKKAKGKSKDKDAVVINSKGEIEGKGKTIGTEDID